MKYILSSLYTVLILNGLSAGAFAQDSSSHYSSEIYRSKNLIIYRLAANSYQHISFKQTNDFGLVPCNGLVVRDKNEAVIFDTPINDESAEELIKWVEVELRCKIKAIIPTHFHDDCLGGLNTFIKQNIPSYGLHKTIELSMKNGFSIPQNSFRNNLKLYLGNSNVIVKFFGEGHTKDNVVGYFSKDQILFGGCLIKEIGASKGFLEDANLKDWALTVYKVKKAFPNVKIIVPGHGLAGDIRLLDYTISLFK